MIVLLCECAPYNRIIVTLFGVKLYVIGVLGASSLEWNLSNAGMTELVVFPISVFGFKFVVYMQLLSGLEPAITLFEEYVNEIDQKLLSFTGYLFVV